ncbi:hypothetical protein [Fodinibius sp. AD559]|uniref:hypothetical protein n=1 Tax=Fodinibius sp. AD559 TaxID=3424179 RepID=UPI004046D53A
MTLFLKQRPVILSEQHESKNLLEIGYKRTGNDPLDLTRPLWQKIPRFRCASLGMTAF